VSLSNAILFHLGLVASAGCTGVTDERTDGPCNGSIFAVAGIGDAA